MAGEHYSSVAESEIHAAALFAGDDGRLADRGVRTARR